MTVAPGTFEVPCTDATDFVPTNSRLALTHGKIEVVSFSPGVAAVSPKPATAAMGARRLAWSRVIAVGPHARAVEVGDRVLFDPEDKAEVEVQGEVYVVMRERDVHAVAAERLDGGSTGLYL